MNDVLIHGRHMGGPLLVALDLLGTFVFALSGAAAGVKSKLDFFGLMVLAFAAETRAELPATCSSAPFRPQPSATGVIWESPCWLVW
jgi:hypothetical protein